MIARYFSGNLNEDEQQQLLAWVNEDPENEKQLFIMKDIYDAGASKLFFEEAETRAGWEKLRKQITHKKIYQITPPRMKHTHWATNIRRYAALFLMGILTGSFLLHLYSGLHDVDPAVVNVQPCEIHTNKGERVTIILPDGSTVKLNACSYLAYSADFGKNVRELQFAGEGYFDVKTNADVPFVVKTSGLNIKAFGTTFNVKAYADEDYVETTLVEGIVSVETTTNQNIVTLKPKQVITIPKHLTSDQNKELVKQITTDKEDSGLSQLSQVQSQKSEAVLIDKITPELYTSWKDDRWIVKSESLESLAKKIERKYDVAVSIEGEAIKKYSFTGTLRNYPLEQVLEIISLNAPIQYSVKEKDVTISEEKQMKKKYEKLIHSPD